jgi:predicted O-methyltransferase YrrM
MYSRKQIQHVVMDMTGTYTELCQIGKIIGIDKSPYTARDGAHRHPYTGIYSMLFAPLKNKSIRFAEIGIAGGGSVILWNKYFTNANFHFFDCDIPFLENAKSFGFPTSVFERMDVSKDGDVSRALGSHEYDVILDDSSHKLEDQIRIIKEALPLVKSGGYIIIEDIFRNESEKNYEKELQDVLPSFSEAYFIMCNHEERYSPGWNNDKLLVLVKA